jgi:hypothetical protein
MNPDLSFLMADYFKKINCVRFHDEKCAFMIAYLSGID